MSHFSTGCVTKYYGATNHRASKVVVRHILTGKRATVSWDHGLDVLQNHERAAIKLLNPTWDVEVTADVLIHGSTDTGYVFLIGRPLKDEE